MHYEYISAVCFAGAAAIVLTFVQEIRKTSRLKKMTERAMRRVIAETTQEEIDRHATI